MKITDIQAELSVKTIEFEIAMDKGLQHQELIKIYKELKELQYRFLMESIKEYKPIDNSTIIE